MERGHPGLGWTPALVRGRSAQRRDSCVRTETEMACQDTSPGTLGALDAGRCREGATEPLRECAPPSPVPWCRLLGSRLGEEKSLLAKPETCGVLSGCPRTWVLAVTPSRGTGGSWAVPGTQGSRWSRLCPGPSPTACSTSLSRKPGNRCVSGAGWESILGCREGVGPSLLGHEGSCHVTLWHVLPSPASHRGLRPCPAAARSLQGTGLAGLALHGDARRRDR